MNRAVASVASGLLGSVALTALNLTAERLAPRKAPRLEKLGMQGLSSVMRMVGKKPPRGHKLFKTSLLGHLAANGLYYSLIGTARPGSVWSRASALGVGAGAGSVLLPPFLKMDRKASRKTTSTKLMTVAWYTGGALATAAALKLLSGRRGQGAEKMEQGA